MSDEKKTKKKSKKRATRKNEKLSIDGTLDDVLKASVPSSSSEEESDKD